jgi:uncharacterized protein (TIGR02246 family)
MLSAQDQLDIESLFRAYGEAWGKRDAKGCAALYASDGDAIAIDGELLASPQELEHHYERQLSGPYKDYQASNFEFGPIRALSSNMALQNGSWLLHGVKGRDQGVCVRSTFVCRRDSGGWR